MGGQSREELGFVQIRELREVETWVRFLTFGILCIHMSIELEEGWKKVLGILDELEERAGQARSWLGWV